MLSAACCSPVARFPSVAVAVAVALALPKPRESTSFHAGQPRRRTVTTLRVGAGSSSSGGLDTPTVEDSGLGRGGGELGEPVVGEEREPSSSSSSSSYSAATATIDKDIKKGSKRKKGSCKITEEEEVNAKCHYRKA